MSLFAKSLPAVMLSVLFVAPTFAQLHEAGPVQLRSASQLPAPSTNIEDELYQMSSQAGVIFAGQVLAVRPQMDPAYGSASGWVEIEFRIDQAIRGCVGQVTYILREWSGLWSGGHQRYTVGQRLLMLLHTPSTSGLSSPVNGQNGAIPLMGAGASPRPQDRFVTVAEQAVDLRWVEARLLRSPIPADANGTGNGHTLHPGSVRLEPVYAGRERAVPLTARAERALRADAARTVRPVSTDASPAGFESSITVPLSGTASQGITLRSVLAMFAAWQAEQPNAAH